MAKNLKTVEGVADDNTAVAAPADIAPTPAPSADDDLVNPILREQVEQAAQMRDALLVCRQSNLRTAKGALQNIAVLQVYHQVARIIRYTEVMDRLEDKLYSSIDANLSQMDDFDPATMMMLVKVQGDLMKSMVLSQELLKPYMDIDLEALAPMKDVTEDSSFGAALIPKESRNAIRSGAQALLTELTKNSAPATENPSDGEEHNDTNSAADTQ